MGFDRYIVVAKDGDGCVLVVRALRGPTDEVYSQIGLAWATKAYYPTLKECMIASANFNIKYHGSRLDFVKQALEAATTGDDLEIFMDGFPED